MQEKLKRLKTLVHEMDGLVEGMQQELETPCSGEDCSYVEPTQETAPSSSETTEPVLASPSVESDWDYGHWLEAKTYEDVKKAMVEAQRNRRPILIALSKPSGCANCTTYWRNVACDGVLNHDKSCGVASKGHPIVAYAKEKRIVLLHISPSKFPNLASKFMGKEYDKHLHKPSYYPVYVVLAVKPDLNLEEVPANDKLLNAGTDAGDTVDFIMGYVGISGKPVLDCDGNQTALKVKTDSTGWNVFKLNLEIIFSDTPKTHGIVL